MLLLSLILISTLAAPADASASARRDREALDGLDELSAETRFRDPFERTNRASFAFNQRLDRWLFDPVTRAYSFVVPAPARRAVRRALANLDSPAVFLNDLFQLEVADAGLTAARFAVNSTIGLAGLIDPAAKLRLERHDADFGQTLAIYGVPSGPYLVVPLIGPTTVRDGGGYLVDFLFRPTTYLLAPGSQLVFTSIHEGSLGIATREAHAAELDALEASSIDYYVALRSAFLQDRTARIWARREARGRSREVPVRTAGSGSVGAVPAATGSQVGNPTSHDGHQSLEAFAFED